jgi:hypothetical protein
VLRAAALKYKSFRTPTIHAFWRAGKLYLMLAVVALFGLTDFLEFEVASIKP